MVVIIKKDFALFYAAVVDMVKVVGGELRFLHMSVSIPENLTRLNLVRFYNGLIDEVRVYPLTPLWAGNRALSPDEIKRLYNLGR